MDFHYQPFLLPLAIAMTLSLAVAVLAWNRRSAPGAVPLTVMMLAVAVWSLAAALQIGSATLSNKIFWANFQYIGAGIVPAAWLAFALQYTGRGTLLTRRVLVLLALEPLVVLILAWTNAAHGLFRSNIRVDTVQSFSGLSADLGVGFWIHVAYSYLLLLIGTLLLLQAVARVPRFYRGQTRALVAAALLPWLANALHLFGLNPFPFLDPTPFAFALTGVIMAWALFRHRLLDIIPVARDAVIEGMGDGVLVLDGRNRVVDINPAAVAILGRSSEEVIGQSPGNAFPGQLGLVEHGGDGTEVREEFVLSEGQRQRVYDLRSTTLHDHLDRVTGRLIVLRDITTRKQAEEAVARARDQALEASRVKTELLANVSHDLRTPLNAILGFSDMLQGGVYGPLTDRQARAAGRVVANARQLMSLINDLLDQAQAEAGILKLMDVPVDVADLVDDIRTMMSTQALVQGLALETQIAADVPPVVSGDPQRLRQILVNLVSNAIKFTAEGAVHVWVSRPDEGHWALQVTDTGCGIPEAAQAYIFDPFRKVDGSPTREHRGVGVGLSLVRRLVDLMGGEITLESQVGAGSAFTVRLPLIVPQEE